MAFKKGESGNPNGRPKGSGRTGKLVKLLEPHVPDLIEKAKELALEGDTTALRLCLERLYPAIKAKDETVEIAELDAESSLVEQGQAIINALSDGTLSTTQASSAMQSISAQARIIEVDELEKRVNQLEKKNVG